MAAQPSASSTHHAKVADVFGLVVQHCPDFSKMQDICQLLLVSSTVRQQLLRARGHGSMYLATGSAAEEIVQQTSKLAGFMQWLPRHAGLLDTIALEDYGHAPNVMQLALQLCTQALRNCRLTAAAAVAAGAGAATLVVPAAGEPALQPLRLSRVHLGLGTTCEDVVQLVPRALLQELAAAQTQKLHFSGGAFSAAAVLQLGTSLQQLECAYMECSAAQLLPPSLQTLKAAFVSGIASNHEERSSGSSGGNSSSKCCLDLQHLTQLQELSCTSLEEGLRTDIDLDCSLEVKLPAQLTCLRAHADLHELTGSTGLRVVELLWHSLAGLRSLGSIAGPWQLTLLPGYSPEESQPRRAEAAAATLSTAASLIALHVKALYPSTQSCFAYGGAQLCAALSSLPRLQLLRLQDLDMGCEDLLALTALTQLRGLILHEVTGCGDAVAAALANSLTQLTWLIFNSRNITSQAAGLLAVCGRLTGLRSLVLCGAPEFRVGDKELLLLSRLTQLTCLAMPLHCSRAGKERFLAGMPRLTRVFNTPRP